MEMSSGILPVVEEYKSNSINMMLESHKSCKRAPKLYNLSNKDIRFPTDRNGNFTLMMDRLNYGLKGWTNH